MVIGKEFLEVTCHTSARIIAVLDNTSNDFQGYLV